MVEGKEGRKEERERKERKKCTQGKESSEKKERVGLFKRRSVSGDTQSQATTLVAEAK